MQNPFLRLNQKDGSIIVIALFLLALMSVIGVAGMKQATNESGMMRNTQIYRQNIHIAEAAALEGVQWVIEHPSPNVNPPGPIGFNPVNYWLDWAMDGKEAAWSSDFSKLILDPTDVNVNSEVSTTVALFQPTSAGPSAAPSGILNIRGEYDEENPQDIPVRYALVGWRAAPGSSMKATEPTRKQARILSEYYSDDSGIIRLEVGVEKRFF